MTKNPGLADLFAASRSIDDYQAGFSQIASGQVVPAGYDPERVQVTRLNWVRSERLLKTVRIDHATNLVSVNLRQAFTWYVITEPWCGDSAQNLPVMMRLVESNPGLTIRIILRDTHPQLMDHFLTNGTSRSIPILSCVDETGHEQFRWGPRPAAAARLFFQLRSDNHPRQQIYEQLHVWYGRNQGRDTLMELNRCIRSYLV